MMICEQVTFDPKAKLSLALSDSLWLTQAQSESPLLTLMPLSGSLWLTLAYSYSLSDSLWLTLAPSDSL